MESKVEHFIHLANEAYQRYLDQEDDDWPEGEVNGWYYTGYGDGIARRPNMPPKTFGTKCAEAYVLGFADGEGDRDA